MTTRGFLLGKFLPPHAGHVFLCKTAMQMCDELTVLVCTLDREPIDGKLRAQWMRELLPGARIVHYDQDVPQEPSEHPDFWDIWRKISRQAHPEPVDFVFGSEPYIVRLAKELDARHVMIDPQRLAFPVSGTAVRENPWRHWDMVPGPVRPHYQRRVVLCGAESTGKSTMSALIARRYATRFIPEYGRTYDEWRQGESWSYRSFVEIEAGHAAMRRAISSQAGPLLVEDTDELATRVWLKALTGEVAKHPRPQRLGDFYILLATDIDWRDDGTRYMDERAMREGFQEDMRQELREAGVRWVEIGGAGPQREANVVAAIDDAFPVLRGLAVSS